jgi:hypothetical protein
MRGTETGKQETQTESLICGLKTTAWLLPLIVLIPHSHMLAIIHPCKSQSISRARTFVARCRNTAQANTNAKLGLFSILASRTKDLDMYSYENWIEDNNAWFSRSDRFDGFDRGDIVDNEGDATPAKHTGEQTMQHVTFEQLSVADRSFLIRWLSWNDRHGVYTDEDSAAEGLPPITLEEARDLVRIQFGGE